MEARAPQAEESRARIGAQAERRRACAGEARGRRARPQELVRATKFPARRYTARRYPPFKARG
jgi:hypothetical protein